MLSFTGPVLLAPAMNWQMWEKPAVQRNVEQLRRDGVRFVDPEEGWLSCRQKGVGRMAGPERNLRRHRPRTISPVAKAGDVTQTHSEIRGPVAVSTQ